jgi:hypothetical protein
LYRYSLISLGLVTLLNSRACFLDVVCGSPRAEIRIDSFFYFDSPELVSTFNPIFLDIERTNRG